MPESAATTSRLSTREREIAELVATGKSNRAIAEALYLSERTVERHVSAVFNKLEVHSRAELISAVFAGALQTDAPSAPDAAALEAAAQTSSAAKTNLPASRTNLVGREAEIADIVRMLGETRLVTVTGAGGVGKTRTALAIGEVLVGEIETGVWLVELAPVAQGSFVEATVARALSVQESPNRPLMETLLAYLKPKALVLILDNCEHVIAEVAALADALLRGCPNVRILATSREPLRISGEQTYRLPSLPVPTARENVGLNATGAAQYPAVVLFVQRALAVDHRFALSDNNASTISEICRRLDGIPLAIELAATRVNILPVRALSQQLDKRFRLLTNGDRTALPRHQTMRATLDWSHDLLDKRDRTVFRRLGIFVNGFTIDGALAVGTDDEFNEVDVFDALASLVDKSLVTADRQAESVRYRLLESTRVYAAEQLARAGERDALASRHLRYFRDWFVELRREYEQLRDGLEAAFATELDDVRVALDGALVRCDLVDGAELLAAIGVCWTGGGLGREGIARCKAFLAELPRPEPRLLGDLGASLVGLLMIAGRSTQAREAAVAALGYARASGDGPLLAFALNAHAGALIRHSDFPAAECALSEAEAIQWLSPRRRLLLAECRASLNIETGDLDSAAHTFERLREAWRSAGFRDDEAAVTAQLADVEFRRRQYRRAADLLSEAVSLARYNDTSAYLPLYLVFRGQVLAVSGEVDAAIGPAIEAMMLWACRDSGHVVVTLAIELLAYVAAAQGDLDRSARIGAHADASLTRIGYSRDYVPLAVYEPLTKHLHEHLATDELARLTTQGASLTHEAAIALALEINAGTLAT